MFIIIQVYELWNDMMFICVGDRMVVFSITNTGQTYNIQHIIYTVHRRTKLALSIVLYPLFWLLWQVVPNEIFSVFGKKVWGSIDINNKAKNYIFDYYFLPNCRFIIDDI